MKKTLALLLAVALLLGTVPVAFAAGSMENIQKTQTYTEGQFDDVKASDWFAAGVQSAFELGLMKGNSETAFKPAGNLTVGEALAIACRLHSSYVADGQEFTQGEPWYQVYVDYAVANKIMKEGQLDPAKQITREQFAYIMCGALPSSELEAINDIESIPDVKGNSTYGGFVFRLYDAGVLTGSDKYGTFNPTANIQRSEVATIVTRMADQTQRKTFTLEAKPIEVTGINLSGKTEILVGETVRWTANPLPEGASAKLTWTAGNPGVATVDQNGNIKGLRSGDCNITVTATNGVKKTCLLHCSDVSGYAAHVVSHVNNDLAKGLYKLEKVYGNVVSTDYEQCIVICVYYTHKVLSKFYWTASIYSFKDNMWYHDAHSKYSTLETAKNRAYGPTALRYIDLQIAANTALLKPENYTQYDLKYFTPLWK